MFQPQICWCPHVLYPNYEELDDKVKTCIYFAFIPVLTYPQHIRGCEFSLMGTTCLFIVDVLIVNQVKPLRQSIYRYIA